LERVGLSHRKIRQSFDFNNRFLFRLARIRYANHFYRTFDLWSDSPQRRKKVLFVNAFVINNGLQHVPISATISERIQLPHLRAKILRRRIAADSGHLLLIIRQGHQSILF
jgi:hypothetical protein